MIESKKKLKRRKRYLEVEYYRKKYSFSQKDFALLLGIKENTYSHKECGISKFTLAELILMHGAINKAAANAGHQGVTIDALLGL